MQLPPRLLALLSSTAALASLWLMMRPTAEGPAASPKKNGPMAALNRGSAPAPTQQRHRPQPTPARAPPCTLQTQDIFGGAVEGASILLDGQPLGTTDASGQMTWPTRRVSMSVAVIAEGYVKSMATILCPGPTTIALTPESVLAGHIKAHATPLPPP